MSNEATTKSEAERIFALAISMRGGLKVRQIRVLAKRPALINRIAVEHEATTSIVETAVGYAVGSTVSALRSALAAAQRHPEASHVQIARARFNDASAA